MNKNSIKTIETSGSKRIVAAALLASYICAISPVAAFAKESDASARAVERVFAKEEKSEVLISAKKGGTVTLGDASIEIPEGALKEDTKISITRLSKVEDTGESLCNAIPKSGGYRFLPAGTKFEKDVTITLPYSAKFDEKPGSLEDLYTYFFDTKKKSWIKLERLEVDKGRHVVRSLSTHFTDMINATLTMPESASPVDVNLNSIKNLEAAKPDSHLIKFNPPKASNMGDASFSFELAVPCGRRGMQPQISVSYSSGGGNGIMGKGFDINYGSSITTDTRFGLPNYNTHDTYMLDGILLTEKTRKENEITYRPLKETSFSRIKRYMDDNHWEVTDKSGTKRIYAQNKDSCVGSGTETFTWNLTKIEDVNKNTVVFEYNKFSEIQNKNTYNYVYPTAIYYTGYNNEKGNYNIKFHYDNDGAESRQDVRIDARSKEIVACKKLLTSVTTHYKDGEPIRTYSFVYKEGLAKEKMLTILRVANNAGDSYEYAFDYEEPKKDVNGNVIYFGETARWENGSAIKAGKSDSGGSSFTAGGGVGIGDISGNVDARLTGGMQGGSTNSQSETESALADIDGDGSPDYIRVAGGILYYRLNIKNGFSDVEKNISIERFKLDAEESKNHSTGWNVYGGGGLRIPFVPGIGVSYSDVRQTATSKTTTALADVNGDRKTDIIISGKNYYLKNTSKNGMVSFERENYSSESIAIEDNVRKLTSKEIQEYKDIYKIQIPFRQWKAEYDGKILIEETVSCPERFEGSNTVKAFTYKGMSSDSIQPLDGEVSSKQPVNIKTSEIEIGKDENLYFITKTDEPLGADVNYKINLKYTGVKAYKPRLPEPVFFPKTSMSTTYESTFGISDKEQREKILPKILEPLYQTEEKTKTEAGQTTYKTITCTLKSEWEKFANRAIYNYLLEQNMFLPGAFTESQFERIFKKFTTKHTEKEDFEKFATMFIHNITDGLYIIRDNTNRDVFDLLCNVQDAKDEIKESWKNYDLFDIGASYDNRGVFYEQNSILSDTGNKRLATASGTLTKSGNTLILGEFDGKLLSVSRKNAKVFLGESEAQDFSACFDETEGCLIASIFSKRNHEKINYVFTNPQKKALNITQEEMKSIVNDFQVEGESLSDNYWDWNEKEENDAIIQLKEYGMNDEQQKRFLDIVYKRSEKEIIEDEKTKAITVYTKKQNILGQDLIDALKILSDAKFSRVIKNEFPFYELSSDGEYLLKAMYIPNLPEDATEEQKSKEALILEKCRKHGLIKYCNVQVIIEHGADELYELDNHAKFESFRLLDNGTAVVKETFSPGQTSWNSTSAWNNHAREDENKLFEDSDGSIQVEREEKLFAGNSNWFFGIWVCGSTPFNGKNIEAIVNPSNFDKYKNKYDENQLKNMSESEAAQKKGQNEEQPFYLPIHNIENSNSDIYPVQKEYASEKEGLENTLVGQISMTCRRIELADGSHAMATEYYFPFIQGDYVHAGRIGGSAFYEIDGINASNGILSDFIFPNVRMSRNEGTDRTYGHNFDFSYATPELLQDAKELGNSLKVSASTSVGGNTGTNVNDGRLTQTIMDVNGDSIPDIIQETPAGVYITPSKKSPEGKIVYCEKYEIDGVNINSTHSEIDVNGASFSPSGSISMEFNKGKPNHVKASGSSSGGAGVTKTFGKSSVKTGLIDINGDGLPDFYDGVTAKLNLGETFESTQLISVPAGDMNVSSINSVSANINTGKTSGFGESLSCGINCGGGLSYTSSSNATNSMFIDINGDGLADKLTQKAGALSVLYNTGNSFVESLDILLPSWKLSEAERQKIGKGKDTNFEAAIFSDVPLIGPMTKGIANAVPAYDPFAEKSIDGMESSTTISLSINGSLGLSFTFCIPVPIPFAPFSINPTFSGGNGLTGSTSINMVNVSLTDLDGDGLPDHALRIPGVATYWKRNISGRYGLLAKINLPQGGNIEIDYAEKYGTTDNPNFKYVMSRVATNDGTDGEGPLPKLEHGEHSATTLYEYEDGYYDRARKDFYGFQTVKTIYSDGTYKIDEYYNREYYAKGSIKESKCYSSDNILLSRSTTELLDSPCPLPIKEESWTYEKSSGTNNYIHLVTEYEYDTYGNCTKITQDFGDGQKLSADITYDNTNTTDYIVGLPVDIRVYDSNGNLLRHRSGDYDDLGQLKELSQYWANNESCRSINRLTYDNYGNIQTVSDSRGATLSYKYDDVENMFVKEITQRGNDTESYTSFIEYDEVTQTKKSEADCNGNKLSYEYDSWQRIKEIRTDYDTGTIPAVSYEYNTPNHDSFGHHDLWYAVTNNKVVFDDDKDLLTDKKPVIQTVIQIDGLGRAVRTAKTGFVNGVDGWNASGAVEYDEKGRTIKKGMTEFIPGNVDSVENLRALLTAEPKMTELATLYEYDEKDRQIKTVLPDGAEQSAAFEIKLGRLISYSIDPLLNVSIQETDSHGNVVRVAKEDKDQNQLTQVTYRYNEMGEMERAYDATGKNPIIVEYDMLGRRTALESKDSGRQEFFYDECSNLVRENNSVLRENNKQIVYQYDGLNRLIKIDYPDSEDIVYTYGAANDSHGAAGKILKVKDGSGTIEYVYGNLGEVKKETRTLYTHLNGNNPTETAVMEYRSDYLGRMQWIIYPDGEKVTYGYDNGGQVISVTGKNYNHDFNYVTNILYDEYGQRTRIDYGNGTFTEYKYDPERRWLDTIKTHKTDDFGNILQTYQNITYDFDAVGNINWYENDCLDSVNGNYKTRQEYTYDSLYQLIKVDGETTYNPYHSSVPEYKSNYTQTFTFDDIGLGNMISKVSKESVTPHKSIGDNLNYNFTYNYDKNYAHRLVNAGDRFYKYDANGNIICEQDGSFDDSSNDVSYYKINQETEDVYSTDYGWGLFKDDDSNGGVKGIKYSRTYIWNEKNQLISSIDANYNTAYVYGQDGQRTNKYTQSSETLYFNKMWIHHTDSGNSVYGGQTSKNIYLGETRIVTKLNSGNEPKYQEEYWKQYYYHSDHLGSASLISDYKGDEYQRIEYTPYGETWVEKTDPKANLNFLPYKFTGKELDEETGLYYYGARYLDPRYSMWISTDPALGEYIPKAPIDDEARRYNQNLPGMGGIYNHINCNLYHYAGNNPVLYVDPDGRETYDLSDEQWEVVSASRDELVNDLNVIIEKLSDFSVEGDEKILEAAKMYLGRDFSCVEDYVYVKAQCRSIIDKLSNMDRTNFKYDDFNFNPKKRGTFAWCYFGIGKNIYLGKAFFNARNNGNDTKAGTLLHEATHLCGFAIDVPPKPYGTHNAKNRLFKNLNGDNYEYFYEYIFKGGI